MELTRVQREVLLDELKDAEEQLDKRRRLREQAVAKGDQVMEESFDLLAWLTTRRIADIHQAIIDNKLKDW